MYPLHSGPKDKTKLVRQLAYSPELIEPLLCHKKSQEKQLPQTQSPVFIKVLLLLSKTVGSSEEHQRLLGNQEISLLHIWLRP